MKKIVLLSLVLFVGCKCTQPTQNEITLQKKYDSLREVLKLERELLQDQEVQIQIMRDELQFKESEISYWGHKYDSCSNYVNYKK